jgi:muramidase (phage lysozyme)
MNFTPNLQAFLATLSHSEGTDRAADPYRVTYAFKYEIHDLAYHPAEVRNDGTCEWHGEKLPDAMCIAAGLHPPCVSTAAGRYQITKATWLRLKVLLQLRNFGPDSQDDCAVQLIKERGALDLIFAGEIAAAISKCSGEWASLPGSSAQQPQRTFAQLLNAYSTAGGGFA